LQDILEEYRAASDEINFYFHNPQSDKDLEEQARKDGIQPVQMQAIENDEMVVKKVYLGMVLLYEDKKEILPVIQTTTGLEYMISTKIKSLINANKKTVAFLNLDKNKEIKAETLSSQLNEHYNFRKINIGEDIPENVDVLLVSAAIDSIDQTTVDNLKKFINSGKKVFMAQSGINTDIQTQQANAIESNIFNFLKDYNLIVKKNLILDGKCGSVQVQERRGIFMMNRAMEYPFFPMVDSFNSSEVIVSDLEQILPFFPSEIEIDSTLNDNITEVVSLFTSSNNSGIMENNFVLSPDPQQNPFLNLLGQPGKIISALSKLSSGGELLLISDSRFLNDDGGMSVEGNLVFLMNAVDYLAGDKELISLRSREITNRPLDEIKDSSKKNWKYVNMLLPSILIMSFGFWRIRKEKHKAEMLKQIYD
ncbi:MAG: Gldg family protein, partial [Fidelibacterota bacterium]